MTDKELMQQILYTLGHFYENGYDREDCFAAITTLLDRLAQPEQKPVAWMCSDFGLMHRGYSRFSPTRQGDWNIPVYTTPPRREWVGLTEQEQEALWDEAVDRQEHFCSQYGDFADAIEAKLKEKNA